MVDQEGGSKWDHKSPGGHAAEVTGPHQRSDASGNPDSLDSTASFSTDLRQHAELPSFDVPGTTLRCYIDNSQQQPMISIGPIDTPARIRLSPQDLSSLINVLTQTRELMEQFKPEIAPKPDLDPQPESPVRENYEVFHLRVGDEHKPESDREYRLVALIKAESVREAIEITQREKWHESDNVVHCYTKAPRLTQPGDVIAHSSQDNYTVGPDNYPTQSPLAPDVREHVLPSEHKVQPDEPTHSPKMRL